MGSAAISHLNALLAAEWCDSSREPRRCEADTEKESESLSNKAVTRTRLLFVQTRRQSGDQTNHMFSTG